MPLATLALATIILGAERPSRIQLSHRGDTYSLTVDGKPFFVKGAGGAGPKPLLAKLGGNSFRTWGADDLDKQLAEAQRLRLKVTVGMWLGHTEQGFNYDDPAAVAKQFESCRKVILKYRNHPAVLMWGIGNEMEGYGEGDNPKIWGAIEQIAHEAKRLDPNHPTMTVVAEIGGKKVPSFNRYCPSVDILGINSYGGAPSLLDRYRKAGGTKPYIVTEFGPLGQWEAGKTPWGARVEATSTEKAAHYRESYEKAVLGSKGLCLGSYAFTWGNKQEETATWFGMLLPSGERLAAADTMSQLWTGRRLKNVSPAIDELRVSGLPQASPGETVSVALRVSDPDRDRLKVTWILRGEAVRRGIGGETEATLPEYPGAILSAGMEGATIRLPNAPGGYRLFAYVYDGHGGAAVGNVPINAHTNVR